LRGAKRFAEELVARVRRAGATGELTVRGDAGFWSYALVDTLTRLGVHFTVTVPVSQHVRAAIEAIDEGDWQPITYPDGGQAEVAETTLATPGSKRWEALRLVVRRTRLTGPAQQALWPNWRHHAFITDLVSGAAEADEFHREHATVELAIRDLKEGAGLEHCPSGKFFANAAWLACAVLAHDLTRWSARLGGMHPPERLTVARTVRTRVLAVPGRLVNRSGRRLLRLPLEWPWAATFTRALERIRSLPLVT
jgi:hypothetical protein